MLVDYIKLPELLSLGITQEFLLFCNTDISNLRDWIFFDCGFCRHDLTKFCKKEIFFLKQIYIPVYTYIPGS